VEGAVAKTTCKGKLDEKSKHGEAIEETPNKMMRKRRAKEINEEKEQM